MPKFRIFAGLGGGFGGATEHSIQEFPTENDAVDFACIIANEEYDSYGGLHGLFNYSEAIEETPDLTDEELDLMEQEDRDAWLEYWVEKIED